MTKQDKAIAKAVEIVRRTMREMGRGEVRVIYPAQKLKAIAHTFPRKAGGK